MFSAREIWSYSYKRTRSLIYDFNLIIAGRSEENNKSFLKDNIEALRNSNSSISSQSRDHCVTSPHDKDYSNDSPGDYLWLGSRGDNSKLC